MVKNIKEVFDNAERIGVIGSPSSTGRLIIDVLGTAVNKRLVGNLCVFHYIQDFQGYASPGILACFLFGFFVKRASAVAAVTGLLLNIPVYGILHLDRFEHICFLNKMAITFGVICLVMTLITRIRPLAEPKALPVQEGFDSAPAPSVKIIGIAITLAVAALYIVFW